MRLAQRIVTKSSFNLPQITNVTVKAILQRASNLSETLHKIVGRFFSEITAINTNVKITRVCLTELSNFDQCCIRELPFAYHCHQRLIIGPKIFFHLHRAYSVSQWRNQKFQTGEEPPFFIYLYLSIKTITHL